MAACSRQSVRDRRALTCSRHGSDETYESDPVSEMSIVPVFGNEVGGNAHDDEG
jgi:hypothetical protein